MPRFFLLRQRQPRHRPPTSEAQSLRIIAASHSHSRSGRRSKTHHRLLHRSMHPNPTRAKRKRPRPAAWDSENHQRSEAARKKMFPWRTPSWNHKCDRLSSPLSQMGQMNCPVGSYRRKCTTDWKIFMDWISLILVALGLFISRLVFLVKITMLRMKETWWQRLETVVRCLMIFWKVEAMTGPVHWMDCLDLLFQKRLDTSKPQNWLHDKGTISIICRHSPSSECCTPIQWYLRSMTFSPPPNVTDMSKSLKTAKKDNCLTQHLPQKQTYNQSS